MSNASPSILAPLERFEQRVARGLRTLPLAQVSGLVVEVSMSHYRVAGLSRFLKLGESVGVDVGDRVEIGEVVRIDDSSATLKPFDTRSDVTIGARAFRAETLSLSPHGSWKGRVIDALGRPASEKRQGRKSRSVVQRRCGVRYGDLAAGLGLKRSNRSGCGGWFGADRG